MTAKDILNGLTFEFSDLQGEDRLKQLILYISGRCEEDARFGMTKLIKTLYFADFFSYRKRGMPITGLSYSKLPYGPVPSRFFNVRDAMIDKEIVVRQKTIGNYEQQRVIALQEPDLSMFSAEDIAIVDAVIEWLRNLSADQVSKLSHGIAWHAASDKGNIPYQAAYLDDHITNDDLAVAKAMVNEFRRSRLREAANAAG